jgi:hypothetical protein
MRRWPVGRASSEANERVTQRRELTNELGLVATVVQPTIGAVGLVGEPHAPLTFPPIEDDSDLGLARELTGQVREQIRLLPRNDEQVSRHGAILYDRPPTVNGL